MIVTWTHVVEWSLRWFTSLKCIANMYESSGGWTQYPRLVGVIKWCYEEVLQMHKEVLHVRVCYGFLVWISMIWSWYGRVPISWYSWALLSSACLRLLYGESFDGLGGFPCWRIYQLCVPPLPPRRKNVRPLESEHEHVIVASSIRCFPYSVLSALSLVSFYMFLSSP